MGILSKMTISGVFCGFELFWRKIGKIFIKNEIFFKKTPEFPFLIYRVVVASLNHTRFFENSEPPSLCLRAKSIAS
jgi:hypothetical protein